MLATVVVLATLAVLVRLEEWCNLKQAMHTLQIEVQETDGSAARLLDELVAHSIIVFGIQSEAGFSSLTKGSSGATRQMRMRVRLPRDFKRQQFNAWMMEEKGGRAFHLE